MRHAELRVFRDHPTGLEIVVEGLSVVAGRTTTVLSDLSLRITPGEFVGICGPNGSGKSTLANVILGLGGGVLDVRGAVRYNGFNIYGAGVSDAQRTSLRSKYFGYVPKVAVLDSFRTARQNILRPFRLRGESLATGELEAVATTFGLASMLDVQVRSLSSGYQQRVNVTRGLLSAAAVTVLDEPTDALDPRQKVALREQLAEYSRTAHKTIVVVSHEETGAARTISLVGGVLNAGERNGGIDSAEPREGDSDGAGDVVRR